MRIRGPVQIIRSVAVALRDWRRGYTAADIIIASGKLAALRANRFRVPDERLAVYLTESEFRAATACGMLRVKP